MTTPPLDLTALRAKVEDAEDYGVVEVSTDELLDLIGKYDWLIRKRDALTTRAEAAEAAVAAVREAVEAHPKACDRHAEDDPIKCGWKRAVADVTRALDSTPYRTLPTEPLVSTHHTPETETTP